MKGLKAAARARRWVVGVGVVPTPRPWPRIALRCWWCGGGALVVSCNYSSNKFVRHVRGWITHTTPPGLSGGCQRKEKASHRQAPCPMGRRNPRKIGGFLIHTRKDLESVPPLLIHIGDVGYFLVGIHYLQPDTVAVPGSCPHFLSA